MLERLQKFLARAGVASRRDCKEIIASGKVRVNGQIVTETGAKIDPEIDKVTIGKRTIRQPKLVYYAMNKPKGYITSMEDPRGRRTVRDLLPDIDNHVKPAGRLDYNTEGLLIFTNDGELIDHLTHPRYGVWKTYWIESRGVVTEKAAERLRRGVMLDGRKTSPAKVVIIGHDAQKNKTQLTVEIHEGRKHQVREMMRIVGAPVLTLRRIKVGPISLGKLKVGETRLLGKVEVDRLKRAAGLLD
ncbi:MAG: rRNA pseudouridine synthase [Fimbriimonadales bacterium]|nr:rRNA pseudouridine synthase [Fimbriimonadales bacterium]